MEVKNSSKGWRDSCLEMVRRIDASYFQIALSLGWQAMLWKVLLQPLHNSRIVFPIHDFVFPIFWCFSLFTLLLLSLLYLLRCIFFFPTISADFSHRVGVNYLFAPWISWLVILESAPFFTPRHAFFIALWWLFAVPVVVLDVMIYGQWFTKGKNFLSAVANPTSLLSIIGNLVGARAAAKMGWREVAVFVFALGIMHYLVVFVTLYQRLSGSDRLPMELRPVFFLFFAAPSIASLAWYSISGEFDTSSKMLFFLSLFLFASLVCRPVIFKKAMKKFSITWWSYSYPISILALAATRYAQDIDHGIARAISLILSALSCLVVFALLLYSAFHPKLLLPRLHDPTLPSPPAAAAAATAAHTQNGAQRVHPDLDMY